MELTVDKLKKENFYYSHESYTVYVGDHRIVTIFTLCYKTATKWIKEVQKFYSNKDRPLLVGVYASTNPEKGIFGRGPDSTDPKNIPYDLLQLCIGSHCLIYQFPDPYEYLTPNPFQAFFNDANVIAFGVDMTFVAKKLYNIHQIRVSNPMDLNELAIQAIGKDYRGLAGYCLDRLAAVVCRPDLYVIRPERRVEWYDINNCNFFHHNSPQLTNEKVKYATLDAYFCYVTGFELLRKINRPVSSSSASAFKKKKKKKKKTTNKNKE